MRRVIELATAWIASFGESSSHKTATESVGILLALAYPDRIAQRLPGSERRYRLANGQAAGFPEPHALAQEPFLAVAELHDADPWARIALAAPLTLDQVERHFADQIQDMDTIRWDSTARTVLSRRQRRLGALVLADRGLPSPDPEEVTAVLLAGLRQVGLTSLSWTPDLLQWRARVALLRKVFGAEVGWPDVSDQGLLETLERWLKPSIGGLTSLAQLARVDLTPTLDHLLTWKQRQDLARLAPTHLTVPTGSRIRLDYANGDRPVLAVKLQELFGCRETPRVADGRVPVVIHLLSPAGRPVQVTQDLARFWSSSYFEVRKELRGRYPKHPWPEDPLTAPPTRRTKPQR
jgi:ATP-dependent helicase HrpB